MLLNYEQKVPSEAERELVSRMLTQTASVREIGDALEAINHDEIWLVDPALRYVKSLKSYQSRKQALYIVVWLLKAYPWNASVEGECPWKSLDASVAQNFLHNRLKGIDAEDGCCKPLSVNTVNLRLSVIKGIVLEAWMTGLLSSEVFHDFSKIKTFQRVDDEPPKSIVTAADVRLLVEKLEAEIDWRGDSESLILRLRDVAMLAVLSCVVKGPGSLVALTYGDLKFDHSGLRALIVRQKGGERQTVLLPDFASSRLQRLMAHVAHLRAAEGLSPPEKSAPLIPRITSRGKIFHHEGISGAVISKRTRELMREYLGKDATPNAIRLGQLYAGFENYQAQIENGVDVHENSPSTAIYRAQSRARFIQTRRNIRFLSEE